MSVRARRASSTVACSAPHSSATTAACSNLWSRLKVQGHSASAFCFCPLGKAWTSVPSATAMQTVLVNAFPAKSLSKDASSENADIAGKSRVHRPCTNILSKGEAMVPHRTRKGLEFGTTHGSAPSHLGGKSFFLFLSGLFILILPIGFRLHQRFVFFGGGGGGGDRVDCCQSRILNSQAAPRLQSKARLEAVDGVRAVPSVSKARQTVEADSCLES